MKDLQTICEDIVSSVVNEPFIIGDRPEYYVSGYTKYRKILETHTISSPALSLFIMHGIGEAIFNSNILAETSVESILTTGLPSSIPNNQHPDARLDQLLNLCCNLPILRYAEDILKRRIRNVQYGTVDGKFLSFDEFFHFAFYNANHDNADIVFRFYLLGAIAVHEAICKVGKIDYAVSPKRAIAICSDWRNAGYNVLESIGVDHRVTFTSASNTYSRVVAESLNYRPSEGQFLLTYALYEDLKRFVEQMDVQLIPMYHRESQESPGSYLGFTCSSEV